LDKRTSLQTMGEPVAFGFIFPELINRCSIKLFFILFWSSPHVYLPISWHMPCGKPITNDLCSDIRHLNIGLKPFYTLYSNKNLSLGKLSLSNFVNFCYLFLFLKWFRGKFVYFKSFFMVTLLQMTVYWQEAIMFLFLRPAVIWCHNATITVLVILH
jgi:hypothetical protein